MYFFSHLSPYFHKLPLTCRTFTCDDKIHSSLYVDKMIDAMVQISKVKLFKDWGRHVQRVMPSWWSSSFQNKLVDFKGIPCESFINFHFFLCGERGSHLGRE